jgi:mono/diheme cytochrome c family protein
MVSSAPFPKCLSVKGQSMSLLRCCLTLLALCCTLPLHAAELHIDVGPNARVWTTQQLLSRPDAQRVTIQDDVAFHRTMIYRAVPLRALLPQMSHGDRLKFVANDGFSVDIAVDTLLNPSGAQAWLAVEEPERPWPSLPGNKGNAGPFYVVWTNPAAAQISSEQWPYQLARIERVQDAAARFPATAPAASVPASSPVRRGYAVFQRTCFACHTLNGEGDARMGPDLNIPHSPTEYLSAERLRAFIRNPQSLRRWPEGRMTGFPTQASLSDADLDAVIAYLKYMAQHKVQK